MSKKIVASKYKNAVAKAGKNDTWYTDLQVATSGADASTLIAASSRYIAFPYGSGGGGAIGILPVSKPGKFDKDTPVINAHASGVTDLHFSPFVDTLLASGSEDNTVKLWNIPSDGLKEPLSTAAATLSGHTRRIEAVRFHPNAHQVVASAGGSEVKIWDAETSQAKLNVAGHSDLVHNLSWKGDGVLLASTSKDQKLRVIDPRAGSIVQEGTAHGGVKASAVCWLGDLDVIATTGFAKTREREFAIWDNRNLSSSLVRETVDSSTGVLLPLFDEDTNILVLAGKGDGTIRWWEFQNEKSKYLTWPGASVVSDVQQRGVVLLPKLGVDVMAAEVVRALKLTQNSVIPISFNVPRKTYSVFHDDLFPATRGETPGSSASAWFDGANDKPRLVDLAPGSRSNGTTSSSSSSSSAAASSSAKPSANTDVSEVTSQVEKLSTEQPTKFVASSASAEAQAQQAQPPPQPIKYKSVIRESKYRYITGKALHPSTQYTHLSNLSAKLSGETNAFAVSSKFLAVPLSNPGGQIGIIPVGKFGRQPLKLPAVVNTAEVQDFVFSPFDPSLLAVSCDDSSIRLWSIPEGGLKDDVKEPLKKLTGHTHRVNIIAFHPLVADLLVSASPELSGASTIKYWDINSAKPVLTVTGFKDVIFSFAHNYDGSLLAVSSKDGYVRVVDPRSNRIITEALSHEGTRGARVAWLGNTGRFVSIGFDKSSQREIRLYDGKDVSKPLGVLTLDISPGVLVPSFDEDTSVLYLWGRGDTSVQFFEITQDAPFIHYLTRYDGSSLQIGAAFLPKTTVDVKKVEIAVGLRLISTHIETVSFTVPRTKMDYFQDDIFPPTRDLAQATMTLEQWLGGAAILAPIISLNPEGMKPVSQAPVEVKAKKFDSRKPYELSEEEKREQVLNNMFSNVREEAKVEPLKQDLMEGVTEDEWDNY